MERSGSTERVRSPLGQPASYIKGGRRLGLSAAETHEGWQIPFAHLFADTRSQVRHSLPWVSTIFAFTGLALAVNWTGGIWTVPDLS